MKFVLEVKESKAEALIAFLNDLPYVKTTQLTPYKAHVAKHLKQAAKELDLVLDGKLEARDAYEVLDEL